VGLRLSANTVAEGTKPLQLGKKGIIQFGGLSEQILASCASSVAGDRSRQVGDKFSSP
jgi:hypothetical protein